MGGMKAFLSIHKRQSIGARILADWIQNSAGALLGEVRTGSQSVRANSTIGEACNYRQF